VEVDSTFYECPNPKTVEKWYEKTARRIRAWRFSRILRKRSSRFTPWSLMPLPARVSIKIDGRRWVEVKSLAKSGPTDRHFVAKTTGGQTTVTFGDGEAGAKLPTGSTLEATYRTGLGNTDEVRLSYRVKIKPTLDQALWVAIRNRTHAISFERYSKFLNRVL
jgi:hypothetical protein